MRPSEFGCCEGSSTLNPVETAEEHGREESQRTWETDTYSEVIEVFHSQLLPV